MNMYDPIDTQLQALPDYKTPEQTWLRIESGIDKSDSVPIWSISAAAIVIVVTLMLPMQTATKPPYWLDLLYNSQQQTRQQLSEVLFVDVEYPPLKSLDEAINSVMKALGKDPQNPRLARMLKTLYQQQWSLMAKIRAVQEKINQE